MGEAGRTDAEYTYERFKWTILFDAVEENVQHLWEPLCSLRGRNEIPGLTEVVWPNG